MQLGFDLDYTDAVTHQAVPWALPTPALLDAIRNAPWKILDLETTGLNPASKEQNFSNKDFRRGINPVLRVRVSSVLFIDKDGLQVVGFDYDQLTESERLQVSEVAFTNAVIAHNAGFDGYWTRIRAKLRPSLLLDTMLMSRVLAPDHPIVMAKLCSDESVDPEIRKAAELMFMSGKSGWSLADLSVGRLGKLVEKALQGPKNWCEPFLDQKSYNYATGDTRTTFELVLSLFGLQEADVVADPELLLTRYFQLRSENSSLAIIEPQVMDIIEMRETGMPWCKESADEYVTQQWAKVKAAGRKLVELEPALAPYERAMTEPGSGVTADLKKAIGEAFASRGIELEMTEKSNAFKIGEKDLRRAKAAIDGESKVMFDVWVALNKAKKAGGMAKEFTAFAVRSGDERLHPNTGHGPVTGRLSSSEPNCQQMPRDQGFRACVKARKDFKIVASDYSALDMRVGAALAIRAQHQILEAYMGDRKVTLDVRRIIERVFEGVVTLEAAVAEEARAQKDFSEWKEKREVQTEAGGDARKRYWDAYRKKARVLLLSGFQRCLKYVRVRADEENAADWGSLRDAFNIPGMDIHSWTALGMVGKDPKAMFAGLSNEDVAIQLKQAKKDLGDVRQTGKVGNLSLLYAMKTLGLMDAAAKNYNIHWTFEKADQVRVDWLATYVEIDLWHKWTELTPFDSVFVPDPDRGMKYVKKEVYASYTLGNRLIYAFGLNAALSYEDQSTGADILGRVMTVLREDYPRLSKMCINQVHDELVLEVPADTVDEDTETINRVMTECAEHFLMPFGIKGECSPAVGDFWLKD